MLADNNYTCSDIQTSGEHLREKRPYVKDLISFYENLFIIQEEYRAEIEGLSPELDNKTVTEKTEHGFPLVSKQDFTFDPDMASALFEKILALCRTAGDDLEASADLLSGHMRENNTAFPTLARQYLTDELGGITEDIGDEHAVHIDFIVSNTLKPFLVTFAEGLADKYLPHSADKESRVCPVCGEPPAFAVLSASGARSLVCSFCRHEWPVVRIFCPFCGNRESDSLSYLYIENEKQTRADLCENCMKYIKSVDLRELGDGVYPPLEIVSSVPLDIKAAEG